MVRSLPAIIVLALAAAPAPAHADFYSIEGRFQCLENPGAVCFDAAIPPPDTLIEPPAPPPAPAPPAPAPQVAVAPPAAALPPPPPTPNATLDPMLALARRIEAMRPADGDIAALRRAADAGDTRALELLAWCLLRGVGTAPDAMAAYELYGKAAAAGVPRAAANQRLVFEQSLTSEERQRVLESAARAARGSQALAAGPNLPGIR